MSLQPRPIGACPANSPDPRVILVVRRGSVDAALASARKLPPLFQQVDALPFSMYNQGRDGTIGVARDLRSLP
jgi:hypothetical protein